MALILTISSEAGTPRSHAAIAEFKRLQPCPSTGLPRGPCHGWIIDHITPLCAGGADDPHNMQWQTVGDAKAKDREERRMCPNHHFQLDKRHSETMTREIPTITVGELRQALSIWQDADRISFSGLTFYRVKGRGEGLAQVEFNELVYLDESGRAVVQSPE